MSFTVLQDNEENAPREFPKTKKRVSPAISPQTEMFDIYIGRTELSNYILVSLSSKSVSAAFKSFTAQTKQIHDRTNMAVFSGGTCHLLLYFQMFKESSLLWLRLSLRLILYFH